MSEQTDRGTNAFRGVLIGTAIGATLWFVAAMTSCAVMAQETPLTYGACCHPAEWLPDPPHNGYDCRPGVLESVCYDELDGVAWELDMTCREMVAQGICPPPESVPTMPWSAVLIFGCVLGLASYITLRRSIA